MNYILAVFKTRYATLSFANRLRCNNIPVAIINTPSVVSRACGISAKFFCDYLPLVQKLLPQSDLSQFDGFYSCFFKGGKLNVIKLN